MNISVRIQNNHVFFYNRALDVLSGWKELKNIFLILGDSLHDTEIRLEESLHSHEFTQQKLQELNQTHENMCKDKGDIYVSYRDSQVKLEDTEEQLRAIQYAKDDLELMLKNTQDDYQVRLTSCVEIQKQHQYVCSIKQTSIQFCLRT